jgi:hypothetical protein
MTKKAAISAFIQGQLTENELREILQKKSKRKFKKSIDDQTDIV